VLLADVPLFDLVIHPSETAVSEILDAEDHPEPLTVSRTHRSLTWLTNWFRTRRSSLLVVDDTGRPLGRILADDVLDAMLPERGGCTSRGCCNDRARPASSRLRAPAGGAEARRHRADGRGRQAAAAAGRRVIRRVPGGRRTLAYLAIAGPGLVAANAGNDAAGIATYSSAGSQYIYRTLFFMVLVTIALVIVQEMAVRLGIFTGKGIALSSASSSASAHRAGAFLCAAGQHRLVVSEFAGIGPRLSCSASAATG